MTRTTRFAGMSISALGVAALVAASGAAAATADDELTYPLVDTGQTSFYDAEGNTIAAPAEDEAFYGQDATYVGTQPSFTDNDDGTVTDDVTGLTWQQDPPDETSSFDEAQIYCEDLALAGVDDWRTPSLKELYSISDFGRGWPYLDLDYFETANDGLGKDQQYWSSNHYEVGTTHGGADSAFGVNHATGHIKAYPSGSDGNQRGRYVRCVTGAEDYGINDFVDNEDGTITDEATGLMWSARDAGEGMDWESALAYAQEMNETEYLGYNDWRLPNVKELQSIVDYSGVYPAVDPDFFEVTDEDSYFWTSTSAYFSAREDGRYYAWYVAAGYAVGTDGEDSHGAGAVRFDTKEEGGPDSEDGARIDNSVRLVRGGDHGIDTETTLEESEANHARDESLEMVMDEAGPGGAPQGDSITGPGGDAAEGAGRPEGPPPDGERPAGPPPEGGPQGERQSGPPPTDE